MKGTRNPLLTDGNGKNAFAAVLSVLLLTLLDQWTKHLAEMNLREGPYVILKGIFEFRYLENHGMAFSLMQNQMVFFYIGTVIFLICALYFWFRLPKGTRMRPLRLILIFLTAGAVGNFIDRCRFQYVRDFLYFSLIDFPIFNVADIYVTVSAILLAILVFFYYKDEDFEGLFPQKSPKD